VNLRRGQTQLNSRSIPTPNAPYIQSLEGESLAERLFYCSKFWVEYCVLAARNRLVLAYLPGAWNGIESWYWWRWLEDSWKSPILDT